MNVTSTKFFRRLICPSLFIFALVLLLFSFRMIAFVLLVALAISYFHFLRSSKTGLMRFIFVSFLIAVFLPIDVSLQNFPGPPRFVPLVMGLPTPETAVRADKGEVMLGGCIVSGSEPHWVWVW